MNVAPGGSNGDVELGFPPLARREHGRLTGSVSGHKRSTGITMHNIHHSSVRSFGGRGGSKRVARSSLGRLRGSVRGLASGFIGRVSDVISTGSGRVVRM